MYAIRWTRPANPTASWGQRFLDSTIAVLCCVLFAATLAFSQGTRGTIIGVVSDQSGAVLSGASVKLINIATGVEIRTVQTDANGLYRFLEVEPATYSVVITANGFSELKFNEVKVEPNRNVQIDGKLTVSGTTTEVVTVSAGQELIDRESSTLGTTVDRRRVEGLPLNGRNVLNLVFLQPGITGIPDGTFGIGTGFRSNGQRGTENNVTIDGANNNEIAVGGLTAPTPRPDAVQEFRLLTTNYDAEFGRNTGAVVNVVTKGGTREFHGNARIFYRPTFLSAARYFDNAIQVTGNANPEVDRRRTFERKEFGGNIGGPIPIPGFKDKLFFFFDYEGRRQLIGDTRVVSGLPTAAERNGNFSGLGTTIFNPATGKAFPGNQIPTSLFSPIARYYLNFLPLPDASGQAVVGADQTTNNDEITSRLDYLINSQHTVSFLARWFDSEQLDPFAFGGASVPGFASVNLRTAYNYVARHTYVIRPNLINSLLVGYSRNNQPGVAPVNQTTPQEIGFTANFVANSAYAGPPQIRLLDRGVVLGNSIQGP